MPAPTKWIADFELGNSENPEGEPWLAASPDGRFTLTFFESLAGAPAYTDIEQRLYSVGGFPFEFDITASASTIDHQGASIYLPDGRRVTVWTEEPAAGGGSLEDVYAEVRFSDGTVGVARFPVAAAAVREHDPIVVAAGTGFAIVVNRDGGSGDQMLIMSYNAAGTFTGSRGGANVPQTVNQDSPDQYRDVEAAGLVNGNFVVAWTSATFDIYARVLNPSLLDVGGIIDVDPGNPLAAFPDVTALADGRFVVTYLEPLAGDVRGRIFDPDGTAAGADFLIGTGAVNALDQQVQTAALHDGRFVTVWKTAAGEIAGQAMFANGTPDGTQFAVNTNTTGDQSRPTIAALADGRFAVSWESGPGADPETIVSTVFDPRETGLNNRSASSFADDWAGTGFNDRVYMGQGNDFVVGAAGNDTLFGEAGNDTLSGDQGADKLYGGNDGDTLNGGSQNDTLNGELGNDLLNGGLGSDTLNGGENNDFLNGDSDGDILNGNNGNDSINGGAGLDVLKGGNGDDALDGDLDKDTLSGDANNDTLFGGDGGDTLRGGSGNDRQVGGAGNDVHQGGAGLDSFVFTDDTQGNDRIDDWVVASDQLEIDASAFGGGLVAGALAANRLVVGAAPVANQAFGQFLYNTATGQLSWDIDGTGATAAVAITRLLNGGVVVNTLAVADFDIVA